MYVLLRRGFEILAVGTYAEPELNRIREVLLEAYPNIKERQHCNTGFSLPLMTVIPVLPIPAKGM